MTATTITVEGPIGPSGLPGPPGRDGTDGRDGRDFPDKFLADGFWQVELSSEVKEGLGVGSVMIAMAGDKVITVGTKKNGDLAHLVRDPVDVNTHHGKESMAHVARLSTEGQGANIEFELLSANYNEVVSTITKSGSDPNVAGLSAVWKGYAGGDAMMDSGDRQKLEAFGFAVGHSKVESPLLRMTLTHAVVDNAGVVAWEQALESVAGAGDVSWSDATKAEVWVKIKDMVSKK